MHVEYSSVVSLKVLVICAQETLHVRFVLDSTSYVAGPVCKAMVLRSKVLYVDTKR